MGRRRPARHRHRHGSVERTGRSEHSRRLDQRGGDCGRRRYYSLALKADGTVVGWGDNSYGQTNIPAGLTNVVAIAAGDYHSLALKADGTVVGWGDNSYGQTNIPAGLTNVVAIAAGGYHSLALKADGTVVGWGDNYRRRDVTHSRLA